ncbi:MAG: outer membrane protein assembly factor BamD [Bacteroidales bacterium]|nr:outer membrane protein assembly factor BamD [Candidatus Latescibacterota bacterium]
MRRRDRNTRMALSAALVVVMFLASCGGAYTAKRIPEADEKIVLAGKLFDKEKYGQAAVEYKDFLADFAGDERGDLAQYRLAECYRLDGDYPLASLEYRILINDYGYSEYIDDAFYLEGLSAFMQHLRPEREQSKTFEALSRINRFLEIFPNSPRRAEAEETRKNIYDILGEKDFKNAQLYFSGKNYNAALLYFDKVVNSYSSTVWAVRSRYYRGRIAEENGDVSLALKEYGEVVSSTHEFDEKEEAGARIRDLTGGQSSEEQG